MTSISELFSNLTYLFLFGRLRNKPFGSRSCIRCELAAYDDMRYLVMECPCHEQLRIEMFSEIDLICKDFERFYVYLQTSYLDVDVGEAVRFCNFVITANKRTITTYKDIATILLMWILLYVKFWGKLISLYLNSHFQLQVPHITPFTMGKNKELRNTNKEY